ncbi:hypothetical protein EV182_001561 [Spiromyces aspiralis]|uniref:Uncharacterized protein n=1 Tax=Spiromyces aspiralis TaxID=68401 RepID=A0ACC1HSZ0_9FUNG|nr:hypothetical protein EV182_001561 [Spiromyces aspiralis]
MARPGWMYSRIRQVQHLEGYSRGNEARQFLHSLCQEVLPTLGRHDMYVNRVQEFYPANSGLRGMNVNFGVCIFLRLRTPENPNQFMDRTIILGSFIHELAHIYYGAHDQRFYNYLDRLLRENDYRRFASRINEIRGTRFPNEPNITARPFRPEHLDDPTFPGNVQINGRNTPAGSSRPTGRRPIPMSSGRDEGEEWYAPPGGDVMIITPRILRGMMERGFMEDMSNYRGGFPSGSGRSTGSSGRFTGGSGRFEMITPGMMGMSGGGRHRSAMPRRHGHSSFGFPFGGSTSSYGDDSSD